jgi:hypothetical protein
MTQPPYGPPGRYPPPYGPDPRSGPPAGYGQFGMYGQPLYPPPPPPKKSLLPWLIVGGAVLLSGVGLLLVFLFRGDATPRHDAAPSAAPPSSAAGATPSRPEHAGLPGGAHVADKDTGVGQARFAGSGDVALGWVQAMADGDFQTAYDLSCADVQRSATDAAAGGDPALTLGTYFFEQTLSGRGFTDGSFDSLIYSSESDSDIGTFTLQLDGGEEFVLLVYVQADGKVCDFV